MESQWKGELHFSHGTEHRKGVLILVKNHLEFEVKSTKIDKNGCFIILEANVQGHHFLFVNLYVPNKTNEQSTFFEEIRNELDNICLTENCDIVIGGDFNVIFDPHLDENGGNPKRKESAKHIEDLCVINDLTDIWRVRNPDLKRFTWRQKMIQRRLDFWLVSNGMQEDIGPIYTRDGSSVWDELGQRTVVRLIIRLCINTGFQTDHPSRRTITVVRLDRRTTLDNSSGRMIRLKARIYTQTNYKTNYRSLPKFVPEG